MSRMEPYERKARSCPNGHVFEDEELKYCPECGLPLRDFILDTSTESEVSEEELLESNNEKINQNEQSNQPVNQDSSGTDCGEKKAKNAKGWIITVIVILVIAFFALELTDITCFIPSWHQNTSHKTEESEHTPMPEVTVTPTVKQTATPTPKPKVTHTPEPTVTSTPKSNVPNNNRGAVFGFDLSASELNKKGLGLYKDAVKWTQSTVPQNLKDFPLIPAYLTYYENEVEQLTTSLVISGKKATWTSNAESLYSGDYGKVSYDRCYGYATSGSDITFKKTTANTYQSDSSQNASSVYYVRQERGWSNGDWEYSFMIDFFEANQKAGGRITFISMYNTKNRMDVHWQINSQMNNQMNIHVYLNNDSKYFSLDYDLNTGRLLSCNYSN